MAEISQPFSQTGDNAEPQVTHKIKRPRKPFQWSKVITYAILIFGALIAIFPFIWMLNWSVMSNIEVTVGRFFPTEFRFENYDVAWREANFSQYMWNSVRITGITITGLLLFSIPASYAFARMKFFGKNVLFTVMLATLMIPDIVTLIPNFLTVVWFSRLSEDLFGPSFAWLNNWPALTIPFMASAFTIFLLRQFFAQVPEDLWDAARIDGAGHFRFMVYVVMPLSRAIILTVVLLAFIASWNSLLWPLLVVQGNEWRPVAYGLTTFVQSEAGDEFHLQMAASVIMILPIVVIYAFTQRHFTESIANSGLKG